MPSVDFSDTECHSSRQFESRPVGGRAEGADAVYIETMPTPKRSIRTHLTFVWVVFFVTAAAVAALMFAISRQGSEVQLARTEADLRNACSTITQRLAAFRAQHPDIGTPTARDLGLLTQLSLYSHPGVEGSFWSPDANFLGYAFPTYEGGGVKRDVPAAEAPRLAALAGRALADGQKLVDHRKGLREDVVTVACVTAPPDRLAVWTMTRLPLQTADALNELLVGVALLLGFVVLSGLWLLRLSIRWSRLFATTEQGLEGLGSGRAAPLAATGLTEMDRLIEALNRHSARLAAAQQEQGRLAQVAAQNERLTALGRMAAGIAHEVRNPLGAMRLRAENAIAAASSGSPASGRPSDALPAILAQIDRLERLLADLLAYAQPVLTDEQPVNIAAFLAERVEEWQERATAGGIGISASCSDAGLICRLDRAQVIRLIDNLIGNALRHTPRGGRIALAAEHSGGDLWINVADSGPGVAPALIATLFDPFVTGHPDGVGLGLAIAREIAAAHRGTLTLVPDTTGAHFRLMVPCPAC